jgi:hypothetical protein
LIAADALPAALAGGFSMPISGSNGGHRRRYALTVLAGRDLLPIDVRIRGERS